MPKANEDFSAIYPTEQVAISFDFSNGMNIAPNINETVQTIVGVSVVLVSGVDVTPSSRLIGSPAITGAFVMQEIGTLQPGAIYNFIATVTTSSNQTLTTNAHMPCIAID